MFFIKWSYEEVTEPMKGVKQGCSLSPYLCNIFMEGIICIINEGNAHAPVVGNEIIPALFLKLCVLCILYVFTIYNQQMHNIFNTFYLYLKTSTCFNASVHHLQGVLPLYQSYIPVIMQSISTCT